MTHNTLENYYRVNFALSQHHKWDIASLEDIYPYERDIYVSMLQEEHNDGGHTAKPDVELLKKVLEKKVKK